MSAIESSAVSSPFREPSKGANPTEVVIGRLVHDWDQQITSKKLRQFHVRDPALVDALAQRRGDENKTCARLCETSVDFSQERLAEHDVLLAKPDRYTLGYEQVV